MSCQPATFDSGHPPFLELTPVMCQLHNSLSMTQAATATAVALLVLLLQTSTATYLSSQLADVRARVGPFRRTGAGKAEHLAEFRAAAEVYNLVPVYTRFTSDQLTPVTAYRCLVDDTDHEVPSFLFESVQNGTDTGRFSFVGARPSLEILAKQNDVTILDHVQVRLHDSFCIACACPVQT